MQQFLCREIIPKPQFVAKMREIAEGGKGKADLRIKMTMNHVVRVDDDAAVVGRAATGRERLGKSVVVDAWQSPRTVETSDVVILNCDLERPGPL